jgi:two-component system, LytTR family, sensor kinase
MPLAFDQFNSSTKSVQSMVIVYIYNMKRLIQGKARRIAFVVTLLLFAIGLWGLTKGRDIITAGAVYHISLSPVYYLYCLWQFYLTDTFFAQRRFMVFALAMIGSLLLVPLLTGALTQFVPLFDEQLDYFSHFVGIVFLGATAAILRAAKQKMGKEAELASYKAARNEAELKLLRQQVNPHFLFNTLNSIYLKCIENSEKAGDMLLQLADMLRYQLEQGNRAVVTVREELSFLDNYIFFEKRRLTMNVSVNVEKEVDDLSVQVAPNLLIPLVENTFKHGVIAGRNCSLHIAIRLHQGLLRLTTTNECAHQLTPGRQGTGLSNLRQRLTYLYPDRYELSVGAQGDTFTTNLIIQL